MKKAQTFESSRQEWPISGFRGSRSELKTFGGYVITNLRKSSLAEERGQLLPLIYEGDIFDPHPLRNRNETLKWDYRGRIINFIGRPDCCVDPAIFKKIR